ncbi:zinc-binding alcohol dehydrogenase family protein [Streptomyces coeruleorubidus]|uniref:zinc-binding alcohol dehydrogenase family protein n=1 Tax=Streptomyces coeruleorubidus TaxID=116188 RepID=UPI0027E58567|nr:zinc-binding alcohol dehydrogenase family protein [Streptomyces bellus]
MPADDELLVRVRACGVCRTALHVVEGDLPVRRASVTPGHQVVGVVAGAGATARGFAAGDRGGVASQRRTDGGCAYCVRGAELLCPAPSARAGSAGGGYAEYTTVPAAFAFRLPDGVPDVDLAPLLCAGIIGHRALRRAGLPPGGRLGLYDFGGSGHLCAQVAFTEGATVHVMTRGAAARRPALELGAVSAQDVYARPPEPLDSAILFAPAGELVPVAEGRAVRRGGGAGERLVAKLRKWGLTRRHVIGRGPRSVADACLPPGIRLCLPGEPFHRPGAGVAVCADRGSWVCWWRGCCSVRAAIRRPGPRLPRRPLRRCPRPRTSVPRPPPPASGPP